MKRFVKKLSFVFVASVVLLLASCNALEGESGAGSSSNIQNITGIKNRSALMKMAYNGGSVLYNPTDLATSQLAKGVVIATRMGKIKTTDLGSGVVSYSDKIDDALYGYIEVTAIDRESISFDYYQTADWDSDDELGVKKGSYTIEAGKSADLNGDGIPDLKYVAPAAKRDGFTKAMYLTFITDPELSLNSFMYSVIPQQYTNSAYPGGLVCINTDGRFIYNKYDVGTSNRSMMKGLTYGDYVIDNMDNEFNVYVGSRSFSSARSVDDGELKTLQGDESRNPDDYVFKPEEFGDSYSIKDLFKKLPTSIGFSSDFESKTVVELVDELNKIIEDADLWKKLVEGVDSPEADDIRQNLEKDPPVDRLDIVVVNRISLAKMYPNECPAFNPLTNSFSEIFPWFSVYFGEVPVSSEDKTECDSEDSSTSVESRSATSSEGSFARYIERKRLAALQKLENANASRAASDEVNPQYQKYLNEKNAILEQFKQCKLSIDVVPILVGLIKNQFLKDLTNGANASVRAGIGGDVSISLHNPHIRIQLCILSQFEFNDRIKFTTKTTSLFAKDDPPAEEPEAKDGKIDLTKCSESQIKKILDDHNDSLKRSFGIDKWYMGFKTNGDFSASADFKPSADAKQYHKTVNLCPPYPIVVSFDARFDILFKTSAVVEFKDACFGGIYLFGFDCQAGVSWSIRWKWGFIPVGVNAKNTSYFNLINKGAWFAGQKTTNKDNLEYGGGAEFMIIPMLELRPGFGLGFDVLGGANLSATIGAPFLFAIPSYAYFGLTTLQNKPYSNLNFVTEFQSKFYASMSINAELNFKVLWVRKNWRWDIAKLGDFEILLKKFRFENFQLVDEQGPVITKNPFKK